MARMLLPAPIDQLGAIEIGYAGTLHRFERDSTGAWFYHGVHTGSEGAHAHAADASSAQRIESALAGFGRTRIEREFPIDTQSNPFGVTNPEMLILVYRPNELQPLAQYAVGDIAPDALSRYVLIVGSPAVVTIPNYQIENLLELIKAVGRKTDRGPLTKNNP